MKITIDISRRKAILIVACLLVASMISLAIAQHIINSDTVNINPKNLPALTLVASNTEPYVGETIDLIATLSNGASGITVNLYKVGVGLLASQNTTNGQADFPIYIATNESMSFYAQAILP